MSQERILLTGAGGGIGSKLGRVLSEYGYDVVGVDLKPPSDRAFRWIYTDLTDRAQVMRLMEGIDAVVHLGEIPNMWGPFPPDEIYANNTRIASTVFQAAAFHGVDRIVYASTAQIYGCWGDRRIPPEYLPLDEAHPLRPQNGYALSKVANEGYLRMMTVQNPFLTATALRFPGVMGMWWSWDDFVGRLKRHREDRDGYGTYVFIDDLCDAFRLALERRSPGTVREYNVLANDIASLETTRDYLSHVWPDLSLPAGFPDFGAWASSERIKRELGWQPKFNVHEAWRERQAFSP
ncbi:MAG TPA: NAD(P)-dependent oxidoreductase [Fimbriimonas sp.]